jgi:LPXTG-motif cell wall-anchored protein
MKRAAAVLVGATALMASMFAGTAFAQYTSSPDVEAVVQGSGGGTAFTGGDASTAALVAIALVAVGLVALFVARRRATVSS